MFDLKRLYLFSFIFILLFSVVYAEENNSIDPLEKKTELERKKKNTEVLLNSAKKKENELISLLNQLKDEEKELNEEIEFVTGRIHSFSIELEKNTKKKEKLEKDIQKKMPLINKYIVYIYKRKNWDYSKIFFDSGSFNVFLKKYRVMKRIVKEELVFLDSVRTSLTELEKTVDEINTQQKELTDFYDELEAQSEKLDKLQVEKTKLIEKVRKEKIDLEKRYAQIEKDYNLIMNIINKAAALEDEKDSKTEAVNSNIIKNNKVINSEKAPHFYWPITARNPILLPYGQQYNEFNTLFNNQGIDIQIKKEDWVLASAEGVVAYKGSMSGLGKILIIKHSASYSTVYTFLEDIFVRIGKKVKAGEKLATCELNADNVEKSVLHFEIRRKGEPVDPEKLIRFGGNNE